MRCTYCRSVTHDVNCPKALEDKVLPIYSAVHKLSLIERRAFMQQAPLYGLAEAKAALEQINRMIGELVMAENAKNAVAMPKTSSGNKKTS